MADSQAPRTRYHSIVADSGRWDGFAFRKVFFAHYEPRLRDNEHRALGSRPLRGGPLNRPANA